MAVPKLLFFITEDWYFCSHRLSLAVAAQNAGFDVTVVTRVNNHGEEIRARGLRLIPLEISRRSMNPVQEFRTLVKLLCIYKEIKPDIVHHVAIKPVVYGSLAAYLSGSRIVINALAGMGWLFSSTSRVAQKSRVLAQIVFRALLRRGFVIVQNSDDADLMHRLGVRNIHVVKGSGVDTNLFRITPELFGKPLIVLPSRMLWDKGVGEFVEAAKKLKAEGTEARFALVGAPDLENPASVKESQLLDWHQRGDVEWWGRMEDMPSVYAQSHVVCLPSYREGLPKSLIEAMACGRAVVATEAPGCREVIRNGENGLLIPVRDAEKLASALRQLISNPELRRYMGKRGREIAVAEFSIDRVISETLAIYRDVLK